MKNLSRRQALYALPAVAAAPLAMASDASAADTPDPALDACQEWHDAERAYEAAHDDYDRRLAGSGTEAMPSVTVRIDYIWSSETGAPRSDCRKVSRLSDLSPDNPKGWGLLLAAERRAEYHAQLAEKIEARRNADIEAYEAAGGEDAGYAADAAREAAITTRATTRAGIAAKLDGMERGLSSGSGPENLPGDDIARMFASIRADVAAMGQGATEAPYSATTPDPASTPVAVLHARYVAATDAANATRDDAKAQEQLDQSNRLFIETAKATPETPRDVALQALMVREYYENEGPLIEHVLKALERTAGIA